MFLRLVPYVFYWITVRALRGSRPPVHTVIQEPLFGCTRGVLRIVILHKSVAIRVGLMNEGQEVVLQKLLALSMNAITDCK